MKFNDIDQAKAVNILKGDKLLGFNNQGMYIDEVDFTIDCGFTFDTDELIDELWKSLIFIMRENYIWGLSKKYNDEFSLWIEDEYDDVKIMVKL